MIDAAAIIPICNPDIAKLDICLSSIRKIRFIAEAICIYDGVDCDDLVKSIVSKHGYRLIFKEKTGAAETINAGIKASSKELAFVVEQDSIPIENKILSVINVFENDKSLAFANDINYSKSSFCARREIFNNLPCQLEQYYFPEDIRKLAISANAKSINRKIISPYCIENVLKSHYSEHAIMKKRLASMKSESNEEKILSCIIPFKNEGYEVEKTINSILSTTKHTEIIAINDCSDDKFDYSYLEQMFPQAKFITNSRGIGHGCIDLGVANSCADYCILIDAHMRFYQDNWDISLVEVLKAHPKCIAYGTTSIITKNDEGMYVNEDNSKPLVYTVGAGVLLNSDDKNAFRHFWAYKSSFEDAKENVHKSANVLGACYAFSKKWHAFIGGTYGLVQYGLSEACLAMKTWMMGGECLRIQDFVVGHVYRKKFPYAIMPYSTDMNRLMLIELLVDDKDEKLRYVSKIEELAGNNVAYLKFRWDSLHKKISPYIKHFSKKILMPLEDFKANINSKFA